MVFVTTYRKTAFTQAHYTTMREVFTGVCADFGATMVEFDRLKGASSRVLRNRHSDLHRHFRGRALWSPSYFAASCGGAPLDIRHYVENQNSPNA